MNMYTQAYNNWEKEGSGKAQQLREEVIHV